MKKILCTILSIIMLFALLTPSLTVSAANDVYAKASDTLINKYMAEADALIEEIKNSPTTVDVEGTKYFVSSSSGNDSNDGLSPMSAWKSIDKVNSMNIKPGDGVFFKRGDTFRFVGTLSALSGVTYSAYGEGTKPLFLCSVDASGAHNWIESSIENVYIYAKAPGGDDRDIGAIIFDGGRAWGIMVTALKNGYRNYNGPVFNGIDPIYDIKSAPFRGAEDLEGNLEFYHDRENDILYLYCENGNPGKVFKSIELVDDDPAILLKNDGARAHDIMIDNIAIYGASYGVSGQSVTNITVQYCTFEWIGGNVQMGSYDFSGDSVTRYGNAVESYGSCDNFIIRYNYASQVYDCCWTAQSGGNSTINGLEIYKNVAEYANTGSEVWTQGAVTNMKVYDNYDRYLGYGFSHQRPGVGPHGGFFYGGGSIPYCENNDVMNNVYMFASASANSVPASGPAFFNFHDNVYIMENGTKLGTIYNDPIKGGGQRLSYEYTKKNVLNFTDMGWEPGTVFYYTGAKDTTKMYQTAIPEGEYVKPEKAVSNTVVFDDVASNFWGKSAIDFVVGKGLFNGISETRFSPDGNMTRAMLVTVLSRLAGYNGTDVPTYTDVSKSAWYTSAVAWAENNNIVDAGGEFRPNSNATREEMADMLYRYAMKVCKEGSLDAAKDFADSASITPAYADGIKFCTKNGIIGGYSDNTIKPKNSATRAEVSTMIMRLENYLAKAKADPSKLLEREHTAIVLKGEALKNMFNYSEVGAQLLEDKSLKFTPAATSTLQRFDLVNNISSNINMVTHPYIVMRYESNASLDFLTARIRGNSSKSVETQRFGAKNNKVLIDISEYVDGMSASTHKSVAVRFLPWGPAATQPDATEYFTIKEIVLFDNITAAKIYMQN
ncbi:MAG: S-layer homology domain-containing protein [Ruminococcaceae bacterium]|nr:S-layer homology domain-containing protein [Oscillospiraceae bacterium]